MTKRIIIVGDLPDRPDRREFLGAVTEAHPTIEWQWLQCDTRAFNLPQKLFRRLLAQLRDPPPDVEIIVVKLACINGREENWLYQAHSNPLIPPNDLVTGDDLLQWLFSDDAALVKEPVWEEPIRAAAMLAIFAKLIKNKSWNNRKQGHNWTQEADLLSQSPVQAHDGALYGEACALLGKMEDKILLCKGGKQGTTKKGWCIYFEHMPHIKRAILSRSLDPLREVEELSELMAFIDECDYAEVVIDGKVVDEIVRYNCRQLR